ncbi:MAG: AAA family ATPase [Rhodocyclaceae bacterium]|nr:AAA family ATPase [Rhodocyclaceae bacterium]MBX3668893.1 AAA family ATPase [Rhodocyclaceae bacterium]
MYLAHFGLCEFPFGITPDTAFSFDTRAHRAALNTLLVAGAQDEGFVKIVGEVGTGKTLLCRRLLAGLPRSVKSAYIPNPWLGPRGLLLALSAELRLRPPPDACEYDLMQRLNRALLRHAKAGRRVVLCLDEAQALPLESLEALRLLSNLESEKRKLIQVVLFGQPELDRKLGLFSARQLRSRIAFSYRLAGMERAEVGAYLLHRLRVAGAERTDLFSRPAVLALAAFSRGVPRPLNILAHKALMLAYGEGALRVSLRHAWMAARDGEAGAGLAAGLGGLLRAWLPR